MLCKQSLSCEVPKIVPIGVWSKSAWMEKEWTMLLLHIEMCRRCLCWKHLWQLWNWRSDSSYSITRNSMVLSWKRHGNWWSNGTLNWCLEYWCILHPGNWSRDTRTGHPWNWRRDTRTRHPQKWCRDRILYPWRWGIGGMKDSLDWYGSGV